MVLLNAYLCWCHPARVVLHSNPSLAFYCDHVRNKQRQNWMAQLAFCLKQIQILRPEVPLYHRWLSIERRFTPRIYLKPLSTSRQMLNQPDMNQINSRWTRRFVCPTCNELQIRVNPATNLARCFRCQHNWNPIDFTMTITNCEFLQAVAQLEDLLPNP